MVIPSRWSIVQTLILSSQPVDTVKRDDFKGSLLSSESDHRCYYSRRDSGCDLVRSAITGATAVGV